MRAVYVRVCGLILNEKILKVDSGWTHSVDLCQKNIQMHILFEKDISKRSMGVYLKRQNNNILEKRGELEKKKRKGV